MTTLTNVEDMAREHPDTFYIYSWYERSNLKPGELCKLIFRTDGDKSGERMWVKVEEVRKIETKTDTKIEYVGILDNIPIVVDMKLGDQVEFGPEHIADIGPVVKKAR